MKIVEQVGVSVVSTLQRADPWHGKSCDREDCLVCKHGGGECEKESVGYAISCEECGEELSVDYCYEGETSTNAYYRSKMHMEIYHKKNYLSGISLSCISTQ